MSPPDSEQVPFAHPSAHSSFVYPPLTKPANAAIMQVR